MLLKRIKHDNGDIIPAVWSFIGYVPSMQTFVNEYGNANEEKKKWETCLR